MILFTGAESMLRVPLGNLTTGACSSIDTPHGAGATSAKGLMVALGGRDHRRDRPRYRVQVAYGTWEGKVTASTALESRKLWPCRHVFRPRLQLHCLATLHRRLSRK